MLNKLKQAVEASMDALAPPPPLHEDFVYHWKRFMRHYLNLSFENRAAVELTNLPGCLDRLRDILIDEDQEYAENSESSQIGPCMEYLLQHCLLDLLVSLAISDEPPGMKSCVLRFLFKTLTQLRKPNIAHSAVYIPLMKLMNVCDGLLHSVCEADEIDFLLHLSAILRKQPAIAVLFYSTESTRTLTEVTETGEAIQYGNILDLTLTYVDSADSEIRVKACQCIILLCSMDDDSIAQCIVNNFKFNHFIIGRLATLFYEIPPISCDQFKNIEVSWTLDIPQESQIEVIKNRPAMVFFSWVDFINQLSIECHPFIKNNLCRSVTKLFLDEAFKAAYLSSPETIAVFSKYYRTITSPVLLTGFQEWLIVVDSQADVPEVNTNPILQALIDNCESKDNFIAVTSLEFFLEVLNRCDGQILHNLILCYLQDRSYYDTTASVSSWSDEEDERHKYSSSLVENCNTEQRSKKVSKHKKASGLFSEGLSSSRTLAPSNIDKVIQSFTNLVPMQAQTKSAEENMKYLQEQYEEIIDRCSRFHWPVEATSDIESTSDDSNPEADSQNKRFYEGPFLRMILTKVKKFPQLTYLQMCIVTAVISKLAMFPHPYLHEYLLNPLLPLRKDIRSLYSSLADAMNEVFYRVQIVLNYQNELRITRERLLYEEDLPNRFALPHVLRLLRKEPCVPCVDAFSMGEIDRYLEAFIALEELCNELATIACVKYAHFH